MIRKLLLPVVAAGLLAGCVSDYSYRQNGGDYYYGQPRTEYRVYGAYGDYYPYGGYSPYGGYPYGYSRYPYGYGGYYNTPRYPYGYYPYNRYPNRHHHYPYRNPPTTQPQPQPGTTPPPVSHDDGNGAPWRNLRDLRRRRDGGNGQSQPQPQMVAPTHAVQHNQPRAVPESRRSEGSNLGQAMRRAQESRRRNSDRGETYEP